MTVRFRAVAFVFGFVLALAVMLLALRLQTGPWATWYILDLPTKHVINNHGDALLPFWFRDTLPRFTFPLLIGPVFLLWRAAAGDRLPLIFYGLVGASLVGLAWAARSNSGSAPNVNMPMHVAAAIFFGLGADALLRMVSSAPVWARVLKLYILGLSVLQFALLAYNPRHMVPHATEQSEAERLSARLSSMDGELFAPGLEGYLRGSDQRQQPLVGAVLELQGSFGGLGTLEGAQWQQDLAAALRLRQFKNVVVDEHCCGIDEALSENGYVSIGRLFPPDDEFWLVSTPRLPDQLEVYVPRETAP